MTSSVYDFAAIAKRLRRDDFFTPAAREAESTPPPASLPMFCHCGSDSTYRSNGKWYCRSCLAVF